MNWDLSAIYAGAPLIERGGSGGWDKDQIMAAPSMITWGGKHWVYYLGLNERHDCDSPQKRKGIGVATLEQVGSGPGLGLGLGLGLIITVSLPQRFAVLQI